MSDEVEEYIEPIFPVVDKKNESGQTGGAQKQKTVLEFLKENQGKLLSVFENGVLPELPPIDAVIKKNPQGEPVDIGDFNTFYQNTLFNKKQQTVPIYYLYKFLEQLSSPVISVETMTNSIEPAGTTVGTQTNNVPPPPAEPLQGGGDDIGTGTGLKPTAATSSAAAAIALTKKTEDKVVGVPKEKDYSKQAIYEISVRLYCLCYLCIFSKNVLCIQKPAGTNLYEKYVANSSFVPFDEFLTDLKNYMETSLPICLLGPGNENAELNIVFETMYDYGLLYLLKKKGYPDDQMLDFKNVAFFPSMKVFLEQMIEKFRGTLAKPPPAKVIPKPVPKAEPVPEEIPTLNCKPEVIQWLQTLDSLGFVTQPQVTKFLEANKTKGVTDSDVTKCIESINKNVGQTLFKRMPESKLYVIQPGQIVDVPGDGWCFYYTLLKMVDYANAQKLRRPQEEAKAFVPSQDQTIAFINDIVAWIRKQKKPQFDEWATLYNEEQQFKGKPKSQDFNDFLNNASSLQKKGQADYWAEPELGMGSAVTELLGYNLNIYQVYFPEKNVYQLIQSFNSNKNETISIVFENRSHYKCIFGNVVEYDPKKNTGKPEENNDGGTESNNTTYVTTEPDSSNSSSEPDATGTGVRRSPRLQQLTGPAAAKGGSRKSRLHARKSRNNTRKNRTG